MKLVQLVFMWQKHRQTDDNGQPDQQFVTEFLQDMLAPHCGSIVIVDAFYVMSA